MNYVSNLRPPGLWPGLIWALTILFALTQDERVFLWSRTLSADVVDFFQMITQIGHANWMLALTTSVTFIFFLLGKFYRDRENRNTFTEFSRKCMFVLVSILGSGLIAVIIKTVVGRARPSQFSEFGAYYLSPLSANSEFASFPSGHSTNLFALAFSLGVFLPQLRIPLLFLASGIAFSRVVISEHFVSDFIGGALVSFLFVRWWRQQAESRKFIAENPPTVSSRQI